MRTAVAILSTAVTRRGPEGFRSAPERAPWSTPPPSAMASSRCRSPSSAAGRRCRLPEAFVPGYPAWVWRLKPGGDWGLSEQIHQRLLENAVNLERNHLDRVCEAGAEAGVTVVMGINERDGSIGRTTLYNSAVVIGGDGEILNHHRKLMPTNPKRMIWGFGDGAGLRAIDTPVGRIGVLLCWENYMPLARFALYAQGIDIHIAPTYDSGEAWTGTLQHIAREGGCWVIGAGVALRNQDLPDDFPERDRLYPPHEDWINPGDSVVIAPGGGKNCWPPAPTTEDPVCRDRSRPCSHRPPHLRRDRPLCPPRRLHPPRQPATAITHRV